jgi:anti-sigma regulatory factor (Ser/Thr protein kinase)
MVHQNNPSPFKSPDFLESEGCGHDKRVLLDFSMPAQIPEIEKLACAVNEAMSGCRDLAFSVNLCLEELIVNTIHHGLKEAAGHGIRIRISISDEWLEILVKDDAPQFDPFGQRPPPNLDLGIDERPIGGLGVYMVKTLMDRATAYYDGTGNLIVLCKSLHPPPAR